MFTTASTAPAIENGSVMSCSIRLKRGSSARCARLLEAPVRKLSTPTTVCPSASRRSQKGSEEGSGEEGRKEKGSSKEGSQEGREESQEDREEGQEEVGADCRHVSGRQDGEYSGQDQGARQIAGLLAVCQGNPVLPRSSRISRWSVFGLTICGQWNRLGSPTHCAEDAQWTGHGRLQ